MICWFSSDVSESGFVMSSFSEFWVREQARVFIGNSGERREQTKSLNGWKSKNWNQEPRNQRNQLKTNTDSLSRRHQLSFRETLRLSGDLIVCFFPSRSSAACPSWCYQRSLRHRPFWPSYRSPEWRSQSTRDIQKVQKFNRFNKSGNENKQKRIIQILILDLHLRKSLRLHDYNIT